MLYLLLTILANVAIFMAFRSFSKFNINTLPAIVVNYGVCVITGTLYVGTTAISSEFAPNSSWFISAIILGLIFISTFFLMAHTTQVRGVSVATVASKMSLAIPVVFSLFVFKYALNELDTWNYIGIGLAFVSIWLVSRKANKTAEVRLTFKFLLLPMSIFFLGGLIDTYLNYVNHHFITEEIESIYPIFVFVSAFVTGCIVCLIKGVKFGRKELIGGLCLGVPNYFSIYFNLKALSAFDNNGAIV
ncbi:MAG: hypothetical protein JJ909_17430, partial [Roseivirga sp.]|nr:hypothetical protein [Roseivirga sp.]